MKIPKLRKGSSFPSFLQPRRRIDRALYAVVMEAYVKGVSTRSVDHLVAALGVASGISRTEVSRICAQLGNPHRRPQAVPDGEPVPERPGHSAARDALLPPGG